MKKKKLSKISILKVKTSNEAMRRLVGGGTPATDSKSYPPPASLPAACDAVS